MRVEREREKKNCIASLAQSSIIPGRWLPRFFALVIDGPWRFFYAVSQAPNVAATKERMSHDNKCVDAGNCSSVLSLFISLFLHHIFIYLSYELMPVNANHSNELSTRIIIIYHVCCFFSILHGSSNVIFKKNSPPFFVSILFVTYSIFFCQFIFKSHSQLDPRNSAFRTRKVWSSISNLIVWTARGDSVSKNLENG